MARSVALALGLLVVAGLSGCNTRQPGHVSDLDGHAYEVVTIGSQVWLAANLQTTHSTNSEVLTSHAPNGDDSLVLAYGRLYDWRAAQKACPTGWHLPSDAEWSTLETHLGSEASALLMDPQFWPEAVALERPGFKARPAGYWNDQGFDNLFGTRAVFWTSTRQDEHLVLSRVLGREGLRRAPQHPEYGFSVRCVRDN